MVFMVYMCISYKALYFPNSASFLRNLLVLKEYNSPEMYLLIKELSSIISNDYKSIFNIHLRVTTTVRKYLRVLFPGLTIAMRPK